jgi:hypothetical protein
MFITHTEHVIIDINGFQKRQRKPKGQSGIDNPETRATLDIQDALELYSDSMAFFVFLFISCFVIDKQATCACPVMT